MVLALAVIPLLQTQPAAAATAAVVGARHLADSSPRVNGVRVDRDGVADDGEPGEGGRILRDVERIEGGFGNDVLIGRFRQDVFSGRAGDDFLLGSGGRDFLHAGTGDDTVRGGLGRHFLEGRRGDDVLWAGDTRIRSPAGKRTIASSAASAATNSRATGER